MPVKMVGLMAVDWIDKMTVSMAGCYAEATVVTRAS